ncbi:J domain-containing protein, partial [bacterium]|nr:J domain-containing protein [bacterium]
MQRITFNPYDVLGVREHATIEEIKNARRELIKKTPHETHPEEARRINEAYQMLIDNVRRSEV